MRALTGIFGWGTTCPNDPDLDCRWIRTSKLRLCILTTAFCVLFFPAKSAANHLEDVINFCTKHITSAFSQTFNSEPFFPPKNLEPFVESEAIEISNIFGITHFFEGMGHAVRPYLLLKANFSKATQRDHQIAPSSLVSLLFEHLNYRVGEGDSIFYTVEELIAWQAGYFKIEGHGFVNIRRLLLGNDGIDVCVFALDGTDQQINEFGFPKDALWKENDQIRISQRTERRFFSNGYKITLIHFQDQFELPDHWPNLVAIIEAFPK